MQERSNIPAVLKQLPKDPGVYLMKDAEEKIIYIGKAVNLKNRVSSYFRQKKTDSKTIVLVNNICDIEYIVTDSEIEALLLESNLIKKHKPKFNISLKDDKRFPYIAATIGDDYPRIIYTRKISNRSNKYFGPYTDATAARNIVNTVNSVFKLRTCKKDIPFKNDERPCLNYQMKRCNAPCAGLISKVEYRELMENALLFLNGGIGPLLSEMNKTMKKYADNMNYEKAARIRDIIFDINKISERQKVSINLTQDLDYLNVGILGNEAIVVLFEFRSGVLTGRKINMFDNAQLSEARDIIRAFIIDYYQHSEIPGKIITDYSIEDRTAIEKFLTLKASKKVGISQSAGPEDKGILDMIKKNINMIMADREAAKYYRNMEEGLALLRDILLLKKVPEEIICFDVSNLQGTNAVASMVTFKNGEPDRSAYRRFKIRGHEGQNDPAMIHEAVSRRLQYLVNENIPLPDLVVIDGGPVQLARALEAAANFDLELKIISLAKRFEEIYFSPKERPLLLDRNSPALKVLQRIRDESHRFAVTYHRTLRAKEFTRSALNDIPGISEKTSKLLLSHFGSAHAVSQAGIAELKEAAGIGEKTAASIYGFFHKERD